MNTVENEQSLSRLVERGGVYYDLAGDTAAAVLEGLIKRLPEFPGLDRQALLRATLEREALMSTGVGRGIALPHPRTPLLEEGEPFAALAFTARPVDWGAPDGSKVHALILIVSKSVKQHLGVLSKISFLCQQEKFSALLKTHAPPEEIIAVIQEAETAWAGV